MSVPTLRRPRFRTAALGALLLAWLTAAAPGAAATSSYDVGDQAVVLIQARGQGNDVTVRSWDRRTVQVESSDENTLVDRRTVAYGMPSAPLVVPVPPMPWIQRDPGGDLIAGGMMPPEDFPYAAMRPGPHETIRIVSPESAHLVVMVPAGTGVVQVRVGSGTTSIEGYHGDNLLLVQNGGRVRVDRTSTTAFVQVARGVLLASDDSFDRIRVRANAAHIVFERCRSKQIETNTVTGSIVYDAGTFDPGLARFESQSGNVALGVTSATQLTGRSAEGHVYTLFDRRGTQVEQRDEGDATVTVAGGGALVNAISARGNVFLYEGSLSGRRATPAEWQPVHRIFNALRARRR